MIRREAGFSLIEILIVMVIIVFVLAAGSDMFISALRGYKQQNAIAESKIEGIIGLEMLRRDIENAGYGLPWQTDGIVYDETVNATARAYDDKPSNPPRGLLCGDNITTDPDLVKGADYLVIKAVNIARNDACTKWAHLLTSGETTTTGTDSADLLKSDRIMIISPGADKEQTRRTLKFPKTGTLLKLENLNKSYADQDPRGEARIVYGVAPEDSTKPLWMPFNRADYRVSKTVEIPGRCAKGTGVLVKSIVQQADGEFYSGLPILDCVADMQVVTKLDLSNPPDGQWETLSNGFDAPDAKTVRDRLHEVHVYILAQEGQMDRSYIHPKSVMDVGEYSGSVFYGRKFDFTGSGIANWQNYRWKVYTLIVKPLNLREANYE